jgi:hypothetical protein
MAAARAPEENILWAALDCSGDVSILGLADVFFKSNQPQLIRWI